MPSSVWMTVATTRCSVNSSATGFTVGTRRSKLSMPVTFNSSYPFLVLHDRPPDVGRVEGLGDGRHLGPRQEILRAVVAEKLRDDDEVPEQVRSVALDLRVEADPIQHGHLEVAEDQVVVGARDVIEG